MSKALTDADSALIAMNKTMQKVTEEMGRLAVSAGAAHRALDQDFTRQFAEFHWFLTSLFDSMPFLTGRMRHGGGGGFTAMESSVFRHGAGGSDFGPGGRSGGGGNNGGPGLFDKLRDLFQRASGSSKPAEVPIKGLLQFIIRQDYKPAKKVDLLVGPRVRGLLTYNAPASQAEPSRTDDEFAPRVRRPIYEGLPLPRWMPAGRGKRGLRILRSQPRQPGNRGAVVPYEPYEEDIPEPFPVYNLGVPANRRLEHHPTPKQHPLKPIGTIIPNGYRPYRPTPKQRPRSYHSGISFGKPTGTIIPNGYRPYRNKIKESLASVFTQLNQLFKNLGASIASQNPRQKFFRKYNTLTNKVMDAEKTSDPNTWTPAQRVLYDTGDYAGFSRSRGYTEQEIADHQEFMRVQGHKLSGFDPSRSQVEVYTTPSGKSGVRATPEQAYVIYKELQKRRASYKPTTLQRIGQPFVNFFEDVFAENQQTSQRSLRSRSSQKPTMPPSMRPRKYSGMGGYTDFHAHVGSEFSTGYFMQAFLKHGSTAMLPQAAKLHAHLQGSRQMLPEEFRTLVQQARMQTDKEGKAVYSNDFIDKLATAYEMANDKHDRSQTHTQGLRMQGKLGQQEGRGSEEGGPAKRAQAKQQALSIRDFLVLAARGEHEGAKQFARSSMQYTGMALQSASPDAFLTLTNSFKLLVAVIGKELVPYANSAARALQGLAGKLNNASSATKSTIGFGTALAGIAGAAFLVTPQLVALTKLLKGLAAITGLSALVSRIPGVGWRGAAVGAAVAGAGYMIYRAHSAANTLVQNTQGDAKSSSKYLAGTAVSTILSHPSYKHMHRLLSSGKVADKEEYRKYTSKVNDEYYKEEKKYTERLRLITGTPKSDEWGITSIGLAIPRFLRSGYNMMASGEMEDLQRKIKGVSNRRALFREMSQAAGQDPQQYKKTTLAGKALQQQQNQQTMQMAPLLRSFITRVQPAYYGVEDMYKRIQLSALAESPLDQEILRIQREMLQQGSKGNQFLENMLTLLGLDRGMSP